MLKCKGITPRFYTMIMGLKLIDDIRIREANTSVWQIPEWKKAEKMKRKKDESDAEEVHSVGKFLKRNITKL